MRIFKTLFARMMAFLTLMLAGTAAQASAITDAVDTAMTAAETDLGLIFISVLGVIIALVVYRFIRRAIGG